MSHQIKWDKNSGYLFQQIGGHWVPVGVVQTTYWASTFWWFALDSAGHKVPVFDTGVQDYETARQVVEVMLRLEGVI